MSDRWATFDCYGTLVDWRAGLRAVLGSDELLARYHELEPQVQAEDPARSYRSVLTDVGNRLGADGTALAESLPSWPVFPDTRAALDDARARGWKLAILSNTDRDYVEASMRAIGVPLELAIVASEIGSYKPAHGHWLAFEERVGRLPDVHVAQSHYHDMVPATALGIPTIWINRPGETGEPAPTRELPTLDGLGETLDELVAP